MKVINVEQKTPEWEAVRRGKITGKKVKGLRGATRKDWIYDIIGEKLAVTPPNESDIDRGNRCEPLALAYFMEKTGKKVEAIGFCISDEDDEVGLSPDGLIKVRGKYKEAVEIKCLAPKGHIRAFFERQIPAEHMDQTVHYFVVNKDLQKLHFVIYNDCIKECPMIVIEVTRKQLKERIEETEAIIVSARKEIKEKVDQLLFNNF